MVAMAAGGLLVGALVVWALTRTVQPTPSATPIPTDVPVVTNTVTPPPAGDTSGYQPVPPTGTPSATSTYTPNPPTEDESATVARISVDELKTKLDQVTVVDVRDKTSFVTSHIPGAYHVPMASVESQVTFLPKGKPIVTYCT